MITLTMLYNGQCQTAQLIAVAKSSQTDLTKMSVQKYMNLRYRSQFACYCNQLLKRGRGGRKVDRVRDTQGWTKEDEKQTLVVSIITLDNPHRKYLSEFTIGQERS